MDAASALLVLIAAGVNFGWQQAENAADGYEYIVQVEPELLDTLRRGESVPIESNVPPEVGPIRKVRIVVGSGDLPRDTFNAVQRTAYFAGQGTWTPDRNTAPPASAPATTSTYDRYGQLPPASPTGVLPPPSVIDRAQAAATETGTALRDGVEAGFQAANQQFSRAGDQVIDATRNAGQEFGQQLQSFANDPVGQMQSTTNNIRVATEQALGTAGNQSRQASNPFAASSAQPAATRARTQGTVAPPPWPQGGAQNSASVANVSNSDQAAARGMTPVQTQTGWTSIGSNVAAPPLIIPQPTSTPPSAAPLRMANGGPSFPASSWDTNAAAAPATIGRAGNLPAAVTTARDLVPVQQPQGQNVQPSQQAASTWEDPWAKDPWGQAPQLATTAQLPQDARNNPATIRDAAADWQMGNSPSTSIATQPTNQSLSVSPNNGLGTIGAPTAPPFNANQGQPSVTAEQVPWLPLLLVSLSLMGSLSANLFLGWSYLDARQKYRDLVRKTADTFRRVTNAAA
jgi:hypothetical protein